LQKIIQQYLQNLLKKQNKQKHPGTGVFCFILTLFDFRVNLTRPHCLDLGVNSIPSMPFFKGVSRATNHSLVP
jgi:hypothetical protein